MSDSTSAGLFADIFIILAEVVKKHPEQEHMIKQTAAMMWAKTRDYDFNPGEMGCEETLIALGLAENGSDEYGPCINYAPR